MRRWREILFWTVHVAATPLAVGGLLTAGFLALVVASAAMSVGVH